MKNLVKGLKKKRSLKKCLFFGASLEEALRNSKEVQEGLPFPVWHILSALDSFLDAEGLFEGKTKRGNIEKIVKLYESSAPNDVDLRGFSAVDLSRTLRRFFEDMNPPLISGVGMLEFCRCCETPDRKDCLAALQVVLRKHLDPKVAKVLESVLLHLHKYCLKKKDPQQCGKRVSRAFSKSFFRPEVGLVENCCKVLQVMILDYKNVFGDGEQFQGSKKKVSEAMKKRDPLYLFLKRVKLDPYYDRFKRHNITYGDLDAITSNELSKVFKDKENHMRRLLKYRDKFFKTAIVQSL